MNEAINTIAGSVFDSDGKGVDEVIVGLTGKDLEGVDINIIVLTDSYGFYSFDNLPNGTYVITPSIKNIWLFPINTQIEIEDHDVIDVNFSISYFSIKFNPLFTEISGIDQITDVDVVVESATDLVTVRFIISFDISLLEVTGITTSGNGFFFSDAGATVDLRESSYDNENGKIIVGIGAIKKGFTGASGGGKLATISFKSKSKGTGNLNFVDFNPDDIFMAKYSNEDNKGWEELEVITINGAITVQ